MATKCLALLGISYGHAIRNFPKKINRRKKYFFSMLLAGVSAAISIENSIILATGRFFKVF
jgi:hypothetical protein